ncbi:ankyrin repeat domain protein [Nitzschia inconspicua]|uniref:Ankyrin repeat domain protein n=1 Tax=Nitzschia inconspicua TaxID=303405 RepID=A0A9K3L707_9STRA|nr:ankyrin repeat domain protein [Nitzschia inconspicua]
MEGIVEVDEEVSSSSEEEVIIEEEIIEEEIFVKEEDGASAYSYDEEEIEEETIEEEIIEEEEEILEKDEIQYVKDTVAVDDQDVPLAGTIPPSSEIEVDEWDYHFHKQQKHIFEDSETILDFYDALSLENVYDMTSQIEEVTTMSLNQKKDTSGEVLSETPEADSSTNASNDVTQRLAENKEVEKNLQTKDDDENIMKKLAKNIERKQRKGYTKRKYKPRNDPYMQELEETVSTWFRCEEATTENTIQQTASLDNNINDDTVVKGSIEVATQEDMVLDSRSNANQSEEVLPVIENGLSVEMEAAAKDDIEKKKNRTDLGPDEDDMQVEVTSQEEIATGDETTTQTNLSITESDLRSSLSRSDTKVEEQNKTHVTMQATPKDDPSKTNAEEPPILREEKITSIKQESIRATAERKLDDTDSTSSENSDDEDDNDDSDDNISSDSSVELISTRVRNPTRCISIDDPENKELIDKVLEESQETAVDLEEIMNSISKASQSHEYNGALPLADIIHHDEIRKSEFHKKYDSSEGSALLKFIQKHDWKGFEKCLAVLKRESPFTIKEELTQVDAKNSTPLHRAMSDAPAELTSLLISLIPFEFREDVLMAVDDAGDSPLHVACQHFDVPGGNKAFAQNIKILSLGSPRVHVMRNYAGETPLFLLLVSPGTSASKEAAEDVASDLIRSILKENPSLINDRTDTNSTLLHVASAHCVHDGVLRVLLEADNGASLSRVKDQHGMLPLHHLVSCTSGIIPLVKSAKRLIKAYPEAIAMASTTGDTPLHLFVSNVRSWISDTDDIKSSNTSKLVEALLGKDEEGSPLLVRNHDGLFPLHCCVKFKTPLEIVTILMNDKAASRATTQRDKNGATPLHVICASQEIDEMVGLIEIIGSKEAALVKDGERNTPLLVAISNPEVTKRAIAAVGKTNPAAARVENAKGRTPFHAAIRSKLTENIVKEIIKVDPKAVMKVTFKGNNNIFHEMCQHETSSGIFTGLLQVHPDGAKGQNEKGNLPLHVAAAYHLSSKVINALIQAYPEGCLVKNKSKEIPLHYAVGDKDAKEKNVLALLKASPESVLVKDKKERTPMDLAKEVEVSVEVYDILRKIYKDQTIGDEPSIAEKQDGKKKKKKISELTGSHRAKEVIASPGKLKKREKKKEDVGLHDSIAIFYDSFQDAMNLNDKGSQNGGSKSALDNSPKSKKKNHKDKGEVVEVGKSSKRTSSSKSKNTDAKKEDDGRKSRRKLVEDSWEKSQPPDSSSKIKSKSKKALEGSNFSETPKTRKGKVSDKVAPKTPKKSSPIDISTHAVKTPKPSKSSKQSKTILSPNKDVEKVKNMKSPKSSSKKVIDTSTHAVKNQKPSKSSKHSKSILSPNKDVEKVKNMKSPKSSSKKEKKK